MNIAITSQSNSDNRFSLQYRTLAVIFFLVSVQLLCLPSSLANQGLKSEAIDKPASSTESWSEARLHTLIKSSDKAFGNKDWGQAITLGEAALNGCIQLRSKSDRRCIRIMKNNSMAYFRAGKLEENAIQIEYAYRMASKELGSMHFSTIRTREVFHQLLLDQARYKTAIPIVIELIEAERQTGNDEYKILDWLIELYAFHKVEKIPEEQIPILLNIKDLTEDLLGNDSEQLSRTLTVLANTYCEQEDYQDYYNLKRKHKLKTKCKPPIKRRLLQVFYSKKDS